jgi:ABC-type nitrate/sulfonate/bicarbonate transport system substrate-binding protein
MKTTNFALMLMLLAIVGCGGGDEKAEDPAKEDVSNEQAQAQPATDPSGWPVFVVAPSEYPSWSTFMTAGKAGFINPKQGGEPGTIETEYEIDIVLDVNDYDTCLQKYGAGAVDAVCITNTDILQIALSKSSTAICPTSTSDGADAIIAVGADSIEALKGTTIFGLEKSVSHFQVVASLKAKGLNPKDYTFKNLDPEAAALAIQTGSADVTAIAVWNPYKMQTIRKNTKAQNLLDSTAIKEQIIDMIVISNESLAKPGGKKFAEALCATFYAVSDKLADPKTSDATTKSLGEDFSSLNLEDMRQCLTETSFYSTPQDGTKLFKSEKFQKTTTPEVITTCQEIGALDTGKQPTIGWNDPSTQLNFDTTIMESVIAKSSN